ncbi:hypothetical protein E3N88_15473 [Mikania micrantha]|uniref:Uncharacterized protein n=1 Tax=Mikania micrantha TaxID=192012 RepID=A0A5N6NXQ4_9ASTR|nr:hypothetical protein E3N88_15473 [Mikania micrantha]
MTTATKVLAKSWRQLSFFHSKAGDYSGHGRFQPWCFPDRECAFEEINEEEASKNQDNLESLILDASTFVRMWFRFFLETFWFDDFGL